MAPAAKKEFPYPEHNQYWPYAEEQYSRTLVTFERFKSWKDVITGIIEFFEKIEYLDSCYAKQYSKLASVLAPSESEFCGSFKNLSPIYTSARKIGISYSDSSKVIGDIIIQKLNELKAGLIRKSKKYKQDFLEAFNKISKVRSETLSSINTHQSITQAKAKSTSLEITDPWLTERALINQVEKMVKDENDFQSDMNKLFEDMELFDQHVVNQLQSVFDEYNSSKNKECTDVQSSLQNISNVVTQLTPNKPFSYFTKKYSITSSDLWTTRRTIDNFVYKISNIKILKEGVVYRQGSYISSNWKPSWLVLTDTGYLHCLKLTSVSKSAIRQYTIHKKGTGENIFKAGQDTYKNADKVKTSFSVQLRSPRVMAIDSSYRKDNEQQHCFSIVVNNSAFGTVPNNGESNEKIADSVDANQNSTNANTPSAPPTVTTLTATVNNAKPKKLKSNKNQEVHQLRADTEEILEDWLEIINQKLNDIPVEIQPTVNANVPEGTCESSNTLCGSNNNIRHSHTVTGATTVTFSSSTNNSFRDSSNIYTGSSSSMASDVENETPLNGQIYPPFKSFSTLIEEVSTVHESIKQNKDIPTNAMGLNNENSNIKSVESSGSLKYQEEHELTPEETAMLAKNILTSDINIGSDINVKDISKTLSYYCEGSDMTLNQKVN